jgi:hypothetical protein
MHSLEKLSARVLAVFLLSLAGCGGSDTFEDNCFDAQDEDGDGLIDCQDDDCRFVSSCELEVACAEEGCEVEPNDSPAQANDPFALDPDGDGEILGFFPSRDDVDAYRLTAPSPRISSSTPRCASSGTRTPSPWRTPPPRR